MGHVPTRIDMKHLFLLNAIGVKALAKTIGANTPPLLSMEEVRQLEGLAVQLERAEALEEANNKD